MTSDTFDISMLQQWVGRTETLRDVVRHDSVAALAQTFNHSRTPAVGEELPPLWHWINFWTVAPQSQLGEDGHPRRGGFLPPVPLPRRMWAGGRIVFSASVPVGATLTRTSQILSASDKAGASGHLAFVTVRHRITHGGTLVITEEQDIVYCELPVPGGRQSEPKLASADPLWSSIIMPDPVLLFRFSALTFNGHRIHYDRTYASEVEGYPGLVVQGPLIATLLMESLRRQMPGARIAEFRFRAVSPLFDNEPFMLCGRPEADGSTIKLWAQNSRGELAMQAEALLCDSCES